MKRRVFIGLMAAGALAGCGGFRTSRANPRNWFGRSASRRTGRATEEENANPLIPKRNEEEGGIFDSIRERNQRYDGTPVAVVSALEVRPATGGAIIAVEGISLRQGAYDVRLILETPEAEPADGVLSFELRAVQPEDTPQGPERARLVLAGAFVSDKTLNAVREIRVRGLQNERVSKR